MCNISMSLFCATVEESVQITGMDFAREVQKHISSDCSVVVVCSLAICSPAQPDVGSNGK